MLSLRSLTPDDLPRIVELNDAAYPAVPITSEAEMAELLALAGFTFGAIDGDVLQGFLIGMTPGSPYTSENYRYFDGRGTDYLYIDRIVIDAGVRGGGIGRTLYTAVFDLARSQGRTEVDCEVNIDPPNPESLAFHDRMGFARVGEQGTKGGTVEVALLAAPVPQ